MADILKVKNKSILEALQNHSEGEIAFCEDEQTYMMYKDGAWSAVQADMTDSGLQVNLYELNKQVVGQLPPFDEVRINDAVDTINNWAKASLYMLYGKEISYFTVFAHDPNEDNEFADLGTATMTLLKEMSDAIYAVDVLNDDAIEVWIKYEGEVTLLYFFNYETGMVKYGH